MHLLPPLGLLAAGFTLVTTPAAAQDKTASAAVVREVLRVCVDTAASPSAIRALAAAEGWQTTDPLALPAKNSIRIRGKKSSEDRVYQRSSAWTYSRGGAGLTVGLFDYPDLPGPLGKQCEIMAWDLDPAAIDAAMTADPRISAEPSIPGLPMKDYTLRDSRLRINYISSDAGSKLIHVFKIN
jgi:hypothetical protein